MLDDLKPTWEHDIQVILTFSNQDVFIVQKVEGVGKAPSSTLVWCCKSKSS